MNQRCIPDQRCIVKHIPARCVPTQRNVPAKRCIFNECPCYRGGAIRDDAGNPVKIYCAYFVLLAMPQTNTGKEEMKEIIPMISPDECTLGSYNMEKLQSCIDCN